MDDYAYAVQEYGVTRKDLDEFRAEVDRHIAGERRKGRLIRVTAEQLGKQIDQIPDRPRRRRAKIR